HGGGGAIHGRLVRDLHGRRRRGVGARDGPLDTRRRAARCRGRAGSAPRRRETHPDAMRDAAHQRSRHGPRVMSLSETVRADFPILDRVVNGRPLVYLDSAASSQRPRTVIEAMTRYYEQNHANVHRSIHTLGEEATELYELARDRVQRFIGAPTREEVIFTRGTTDGLGLVAETIGRTLTAGDEIVVTEVE